MALAALGAVLYGIEWILEGTAGLIELGSALDIGGLGVESAFEFGEGELALFSDFGSNSAELGQTIQTGAKSLAGHLNTARQIVHTTDKVIDKVKETVKKN